MYDVLIVGGGLHGGFTAWHLKRREPDLKIAIVERDPTYEHAASARSNAGVRVLFSQEENLRMSQYGHVVYGDFADLMEIDGEKQPLSFWRQGYLFLSNTTAQADDMAANYELQSAMGAEADLIDAAELKRRVPSLNVEDVTLAVHSPKDGWLDPYGALTGVRRKNRSMGVEYIQATVTGFDVAGGKIEAARLDDG
ncbi:MAG: FAD-dependent oxidoreductase, partial [Alphaproteobacteria bacterium]